MSGTVCFQDGILNPHAASCTCAACCDDMSLVSAGPPPRPDRGQGAVPLGGARKGPSPHPGRPMRGLPLPGPLGQLLLWGGGAAPQRGGPASGPQRARRQPGAGCPRPGFRGQWRWRERALVPRRRQGRQQSRRTAAAGGTEGRPSPVAVVGHLGARFPTRLRGRGAEGGRPQRPCLPGAPRPAGDRPRGHTRARTASTAFAPAPDTAAPGLGASTCESWGHR